MQYLVALVIAHADYIIYNRYHHISHLVAIVDSYHRYYK